MKSKIKFSLVVFAAMVFCLASCNNGSETKSDAKSEMQSDSSNRPLAAGEKAIYQCPMHPEEKSDKPAKCPKCGMDMVRVIVKDTVK